MTAPLPTRITGAAIGKAGRRIREKARSRSRLEAEDGRQRQPVGVLAGDVAAIDHVDVELIDRPPPQADLEARGSVTPIASWRGPSWPNTSAVSTA
jgi:hypothetical protein